MQTCPQTCFDSIQEGLVSTYIQSLTSVVSLDKRVWLVSDRVVKAAVCSLATGNLTESSTAVHREQEQVPDGNGSHSLQSQLGFQPASSRWKVFFSLIRLTQSLSYPVPIKFTSFPSVTPPPFPQSFCSPFLAWCEGKVLCKSTVGQCFWSHLMQVRNGGGGFLPSQASSNEAVCTVTILGSKNALLHSSQHSLLWSQEV